jgi:hypothetical protein
MQIAEFVIIPAEAGMMTIPKYSRGVLHKNFRWIPVSLLAGGKQPRSVSRGLLDVL